MLQNPHIFSGQAENILQNRPLLALITDSLETLKKRRER